MTVTAFICAGIGILACLAAIAISTWSIIETELEPARA